MVSSIFQSRCIVANQKVYIKAYIFAHLAQKASVRVRAACMYPIYVTAGIRARLCPLSRPHNPAAVDPTRSIHISSSTVASQARSEFTPSRDKMMLN